MNPLSVSVSSSFQGGQVARKFREWTRLTSDPYILAIIKGDKFDFVEKPPTSHFAFNVKFSASERAVVWGEIEKLRGKRVIVPCMHEKHEFVSPIFITSKSDGGHRLILNLKRLNEFIRYEHFKMDSIREVLLLVTPNCYMAKLDLKDAYYSVRVHPSFRRYLKFEFEGVLYQFVCFPNGLGPCPRKFTKIMKVPLSALRSGGNSVSGYIDDFFTCAFTFEGCSSSVAQMQSLFVSLGFTIHPDKSLLIPSQRLEFLGFMIDSVSMTVTLTNKKKRAFKKLINQVLTINAPTIRLVAKLLGTIVSSFPASRYGLLYYRCLEWSCFGGRGT